MQAVTLKGDYDWVYITLGRDSHARLLFGFRIPTCGGRDQAVNLVARPLPVQERINATRQSASSYSCCSRRSWPRAAPACPAG